MEEDQSCAPTEDEYYTDSKLSDDDKRHFYPQLTMADGTMNLGEIFLQDDIDIDVCDPTVKEGGLMGKHVLYNVKGSDSEGPFQNYRRYNDFHLLRNALLERWPGCYIPPIPPKKLSGRFDSDFIENRRKLLKHFLKQVCAIKYLYQSDEVKIFLKGLTDVEKALKGLEPQTSEALVMKYQQVFAPLSGKEIGPSLMDRITTFTDTIRGTSAALEDFKKLTVRVGKTYSSYLTQQHQLCTAIDSLEDNHLTTYCEEDTSPLVFRHEDMRGKLHDNLKSMEERAARRQFDGINDWARVYCLEISAYIDALKGKSDVEMKKEKAQNRIKSENTDLDNLKAGKKSFKSMTTGIFRKTSQSEQMANKENSINSLQKDVENYQLALDIITLNLGYVEIPKFEKEIMETYSVYMKDFIKEIASETYQGYEFWSKISSSLPQE